MSTDATSELANFHQFVGNALRRGEATLLLEQWRSQNPLSDDVAAVQGALRDMAAGDTGIPLEEYQRRVIARHGLSTGLISASQK